MSAHTEPASAYLSPEAVAQIAGAVASHGGNEVFFLGRCAEPGGLVVEVEVLCYGSSDAVPALLDRPEPGEVVIHNHPSGGLAPSGPDVQLAAHYGNNDVAFFIVDNAATRVCPVVKPRAPRREVPLDKEALKGVLGEGGDLARAIPGYEHRPQQLQMAELVADAFNHKRIALIEAGTGTGKSLAYLAPAALWANENRRRVIIATHTKNLQAQLSAKDVPLLLGATDLDIEAAVLKGRGNYLCIRKLDQRRANPALFEDEEGRALADVAQWSSDVAEEGTWSELNRRLPEGLWENISCDPDDCNRVHCPAYERCFYFTARRQAAKAQILIVNHHLMVADLFLRAELGDYKRQAVLPPASRIIFDEAHHLEDVVTSFGSAKVSRRGLIQRLGRLHRMPRKKNQGPKGSLPALSRVLLSDKNKQQGGDGLADRIHQRILPRLTSLREAVDRVLTDLAVEVQAQLGERRKGESLRFKAEDQTSPLWVELVEPLLGDLTDIMGGLVGQLSDLLEECLVLSDARKEPLSGLLLEIGAVRNKLRTVLGSLRTFLEGDENIVRWMEIDRPRREGGFPTAKICVSPIDVSGLIHDNIFKPMDTVILTSATLSSGGSFDYQRQSLGLVRGNPPAQAKRDPGDLPQGDRTDTLAIPSPFDLARQVYFGVPRNLPGPGSGKANQVLAAFLGDALAITRGGAFLLFTAFSTLGDVHRALERQGVPWTLLRHGEGSRSDLLDRFRKDHNAVLLGADSFWEGVDVQGQSLRMVVLTRLPFRVPTEPVFEARCELLAARGGDPFRDLSLPQAVIRFKQGFGRLIRHRGDFGAIIVTDPRVVTKRYGRAFLRAVSEVPLRQGRGEDILVEMADFFAHRDR